LYISKSSFIKIIVLSLLLFFILSLFGFKTIEKIFYPYPYKQTVEKYSFAYGVDPLLVVAVMREESHFNPQSNSHKGAIGLMQVMPNTAKDIAIRLREDYNEVNLEDPEVNIRYGIWYLSQLNKQFSGNSILVLAAYNAGSARVNDWLNTTPLSFNTYLIKDIPFNETREYVQKVLKSYQRYSKIYNDRTYTLK